MPFWDYFFGGGEQPRVDVPDDQGITTQIIRNTPVHDHLMTGAAMQMQAQQQAANQVGAAQGQTGAFMGTLGQQQYQRVNIMDTMDYAYGMRYTTPTRPRQQERTRGLSITQALEDLGYAFANEGLSFHEITVPKDTFGQLYTRFGMEVRFYNAVDPTQPPIVEPPPSSFIFNTAMGRIKIICEGNQRKFDLEKYLEVI